MTPRFGTAGLRAPMGAGPDRFNDATVARCVHGLVTTALETWPEVAERGVVIGYDGRIDSDRFATVAVEVAAALGVPSFAFAGPVPTPLVAYAVRTEERPLGLMVTASHNPPVYNGLKVFGPGGAQVVPPFDVRAEAAMAAVAEPVPRAPASPTLLDLEDAFLAALGASRRDSGPIGLRVTYSAMHGVGSRLFRRLAAAHGLEVSPVVAQDAPDGRFPTVTSPNPEEPAALALALAQAEAEGSELVLVHDPDADRLAAAVPHGGELVVLTGDQIGVLLADHVLAAPDPDAVVLSTVVSSRMVERLAGARGAESLRTRTGFKWMARAAAALAPPRRAVLAYEQALGYSVGDVVRDKDGLGAGLVLAEAAARQRARGRTLVDRWAELEDELGAFRTAAHAVTWAPGEEARARAAFAHARAAPPLRVPGLEAPVRVDYGDPGAIQDGGPPFELFVETFPDGSWWGLRPSGTEPKLKVYVEAREPPGPGAGERAAARADAIRRAARARLEEHAP